MAELGHVVHIYSAFSILINDTPAGFLRSFWGLRQGDPLSRHLFGIGMDVLSCPINKAMEGDFLSGKQDWELKRRNDFVSSVLW